jgi:hypothetical protein
MNGRASHWAPAALVLASVFVAVGGCTTTAPSTGPTTEPQSVPSSTPLIDSPIPTAAAPATAITGAVCSAPDLRAQGMRQGGGGSEDVEIVLTNVGSAACRLPHIPARIELLTRDGHPLPLDTRPPVGSPGPDVELAPGDAPSGDLVAYWSNWCGASPGPLSARITFRPGLQLTCRCRRAVACRSASTRHSVPGS